MVDDNEEKQKPWKPTVLVLAGGGIKGMIQLGAMLYLEDKGYLNDIKVVTGVSVGAVIGLLFVCGYSILEIIEMSLEIKNLFQDISSLSLTDMRRHRGILDHDIFRTKLAEKISRKFGFVPTLYQLYLSTGIKFEATTGNLSKDSVVYLSHESEPQLSCVEAVLLSMNIPFLFYRMSYKGDLYVDGAFANSFPIHLYDDHKTDILGLYISSPCADVENSLIMFLYKVIVMSMTSMKTLLISKASPRCKVLELSVDTNDLTGVTMDFASKAKMIVSGFESARKLVSGLNKKN
jgi:predicted acylesterase/phospholipase RssA